MGKLPATAPLRSFDAVLLHRTRARHSRQQREVTSGLGKFRHNVRA